MVCITRKLQQQNMCVKKIITYHLRPSASHSFFSLCPNILFSSEKQVADKVADKRTDGWASLDWREHVALGRAGVARYCAMLQQHLVGGACHRPCLPGGGWMKGKALCPPFLQTMTHTHSPKLCDASWDMGHRISPVFVAKKHVPSKRPKSGFARTKAILMILMLIVQSNRSGRSYFGCLRNPRRRWRYQCTHSLNQANIVHF